MPIVYCRVCKKEFYAKPSLLKIGWGKYCSAKCQYKAQRKGKFVYCYICRKEIWRKPRQLNHSKSKKYFCTKSHQTLWRNHKFSGSQHPNWKGGENIEHKALLLKNGIKPICKLCGCEDKRVLAVHHHDGNKKNNNIKNLVWICHNCHHLVHRYKIKIYK
ncbi:MAG: hypothetical protein FJZ05_00300 [Candidatus Nealsonbacteria bacterium]|nr:hypothetical protein [Candidatus Nealsonbacteria bacterium]